MQHREHRAQIRFDVVQIGRALFRPAFGVRELFNRDLDRVDRVQNLCRRHRSE